MKLILILLGIVLIVLGGIYLMVPAESLPAFLPGHEVGLARPRMKHGMVSGVIGIVLLAAGWWLGRK